MDAAIVVKFGPPRAGREGLGLQVFAASMEMWERLVAQGRCEPAEVYLFSNGGGMTIAKGEESSLIQLMVDDEFVAMRMRALAICDGLTTELTTTGEGIEPRMTVYAKEMAELGLL